MSEIIVGLDVGTTKIACFVGRKNEHGKIEILSMGKADSHGVTRGVVSNIEKTVKAIKEAVIQAQENIEGDLIIGRVNVGIAGQHIKSLQHRGMYTRESNQEEISQKDIDALIDNMYKLVMEPGEEIIHVLPQEYIIDDEKGIIDPIGMEGIRLEANFHIIAGKIAAAKNIQKCIHRAEIEVEETILEPLASAQAVLSEEEKEAGVVLVDIGGGTTDMAIFHEGIIRHTAVIPFGGKAITDDIKEGCTILQRQAETLKMKFGSALASESQENEVVCIPGLRGRAPKEISIKNLSGIIQARMEEIIEHIYYEIKNSGYERKLIGGIVVTGGGAELNNINQLFEYVTGMDTRVGYPNEHLGKSNIDEILTSPMFATGIGLVLKGFESQERSKRSEETIKTHSKKTKGSFFDKLLDKSKRWFEEDVD